VIDGWRKVSAVRACKDGLLGPANASPSKIAATRSERHRHACPGSSGPTTSDPRVPVDIRTDREWAIKVHFCHSRCLSLRLLYSHENKSGISHLVSRHHEEAKLAQARKIQHAVSTFKKRSHRGSVPKQRFSAAGCRSCSLVSKTIYDQAS
jgi:hypothetical protein